MHPEDLSLSPSSSSSSPAPDAHAAARLVLGMARRLHKAAMADSLAVSLPVLRRLLTSQTLRHTTLPGLHRDRHSIQRKHLLRMLAVEAGHAGWEAYRHALARMTPAELPHFDLLRPAAGYPNLWFSTPAQARAHAAQHGGRVVPVGTQAVVIEAVRPVEG